MPRFDGIVALAAVFAFPASVQAAESPSSTGPRPSADDLATVLVSGKIGKPGADQPQTSAGVTASTSPT